MSDVINVGTLESCDAMVTIQHNKSNKNKIMLESPAISQYGNEIYVLINTILADNNINGVNIKVVDRGALNYVLQARLETAIDKFNNS